MFCAAFRTGDDGPGWWSAIVGNPVTASAMHGSATVQAACTNGFVDAVLLQTDQTAVCQISFHKPFGRAPIRKRLFEFQAVFLIEKQFEPAVFFPNFV